MFELIPLTEIVPSSMNPRKDFSGPEFDQLCASINSVVVIEPIIVRRLNGKKGPFEIVAGERRFKASVKLGLPTIPAVVRELSDEAAYDFMLIENLQRADLTELEEAQSFKAWADKHKGDGAVKELGEKTGIRPPYIRTRIAALTLPKPVLEA